MAEIQPTTEERKKDPNAVDFFNILAQRIADLTSSNPNLSMNDFNTFCGQDIREALGLKHSSTQGEFSIEQVAQYFGVEYKTIYRAVKAGEIPAHKVGSRIWRIPASAVHLYFNISVIREQPEGLKQLQEAYGKKDLDVLNNYQANKSIPSLWNQYVQSQSQSLVDFGWHALASLSQLTTPPCQRQLPHF